MRAGLIHNNSEPTERRWVKRQSASISALVQIDDNTSHACRVTSINPNGMFIKIHTVTFVVGTLLTIDLILNFDGEDKYCRESVRVVHTVSDGVAVAFSNYSFLHLRAIQTIYYMLSDKRSARVLQRGGDDIYHIAS